jgi:hypothetical protein
VQEELPHPPRGGRLELVDPPRSGLGAVLDRDGAERVEAVSGDPQIRAREPAQTLGASRSSSSAQALSTPGSGVVGPVLGRGVLEGKHKLRSRAPHPTSSSSTSPSHPGGHTGWHSRPGPVVVLVAAGELTYYPGHDRKCRPRTYSAGESFIDPGRGNAHIAPNEGTVPIALYATYLDVPVGGAFRIDVPDPGNCSF